MKKFLMLMAMALLLPTMVFAKGAVIGYFQSWIGYPDDALDKLTHAIVFQLIPNNDGSLTFAGNESGLNSFVTAAHNKGVKVIIAVGGWEEGKSGSAGSPNWVSATNSANRANFVNNIKNYVNSKGLDGVDIDWEYPANAPGGGNAFDQWIALLEELKVALPGKRISTAVPGELPSGYYNNTVKTKIFNAVDAIHLMSYDMCNWPSHSDAAKSTQLIDAWAVYGNGQSGFSKEKLILGCAFYSRCGTVSSNGDNTSSLQTKVNHCYDNSYGGVMIWEVKKNDANTNTLLSAIWSANNAKGGYKPTNEVQQYQISVSYSQSGGTVKNGATTVASGTKITVDDGKNLTLTFTANSGYSITDVKVDGASKGKVTSYTFSNVKTSAAIVVEFTKDGETPTGDPDLADGSLGDTLWYAICDKDDAKYNGSKSTLAIIKQGNPLTANWTLGNAPATDDGDWPYASIGFYTGPDDDWTGTYEIVIKYSANQPTYIALSSKNGHDYFVELPIGNNQTKTIKLNEFQAFDWDAGSHSLKLSEVEGLLLAAYDSYGKPTNLTVTSLVVKGLKLNWGGGEDCVHNWVWTTTLQPKCDAEGKKIEKCSKCGITQGSEQSIPATGNCQEPKENPDLADGSWGDDAWSEVYDEGKNGSSLSITKQGAPITATWKLGDEPDWETAGDDDAPYAGIGFYTGDAADWSKITEVVIQYSSDQPTYLALSSSNGHEYFVELPAGNNKTMTFSASSFQKFDWDAGSHSLNLSEVNGIVIAALDSYGKTTNLTVTSLVVKGLVIETDDTPVVERKAKSVSKVMNAGIMNGAIKLSLPITAKNAMVTLFDVRGRMLMQQQISINSGVASVELPKNIARNQAAILQVKTNSGINLTKRVLIK